MPRRAIKVHGDAMTCHGNAIVVHGNAAARPDDTTHEKLSGKREHMEPRGRGRKGRKTGEHDTPRNVDRLKFSFSLSRQAKSFVTG